MTIVIILLLNKHHTSAVTMKEEWLKLNIYLTFRVFNFNDGLAFCVCHLIIFAFVIMRKNIQFLGSE